MRRFAEATLRMCGAENGVSIRKLGMVATDLEEGLGEGLGVNCEELALSERSESKDEQCLAIGDERIFRSDPKSGKEVVHTDGGPLA